MTEIVIYEYWNDYTKLNYGDKTKLCYIDMDSATVHVKSEDVYSDLLGDVAKRFYTSSYKVERPLPIGKNKKLIGLINDELGGKIIKELIVLRPKMVDLTSALSPKIRP